MQHDPIWNLNPCRYGQILSQILIHFSEVCFTKILNLVLHFPLDLNSRILNMELMLESYHFTPSLDALNTLD
jgi:hypothetical protein